MQPAVNRYIHKRYTGLRKVQNYDYRLSKAGGSKKRLGNHDLRKSKIILLTGRYVEL